MKKLFIVMSLIAIVFVSLGQGQFPATSKVPPDGFVYQNPPDQGVRCVVVCPPGGIDEAEPCGSDYNGGCNMPVPQFTPVSCGDVICGNAWYDGGTRDTDWFEITLTENTQVTLRLYSEAQSTFFGLVAQYNPGIPGCNNLMGSLDPYMVATSCNESILTFSIGPGTFYFFVGLDFTGPTYLCGDGGVNYLFTVDCGEEVPVAPWALLVGIGLILVFTVIRFKRLA